jgi:hypothetical protein
MELGVRRRGGSRVPFPPVVANGRNARTLHYVTNAHLLREGDLVLLDGGSEYGGCKRVACMRNDVRSRVLSQTCLTLRARFLSTRPSRPRSATCTSACSTSTSDASTYGEVDDSSLSHPPLQLVSREDRAPQSLDTLQRAAERWLSEHMLDMRLLRGSLESVVSSRVRVACSRSFLIVDVAGFFAILPACDRCVYFVCTVSWQSNAIMSRTLAWHGHARHA